MRTRGRAGDAAAERVPTRTVISTPATVGARRRWVAAIVAVPLVAATALLILGVLLEQDIESGTEHPIVAATGEPQDSHHDESTEGTHAEPGVPPIAVVRPRSGSPGSISNRPSSSPWEGSRRSPSPP